MAPLTIVLALLAIGGIAWALTRGPSDPEQAAATPTAPTGAPAAAAAPALVGLSLAEARRQAAERGIELGVVEQASDAPAGTVIAQDPPADAALPGAAMQVTVSAGAAPVPPAPVDGGGGGDNGKGKDKDKDSDKGKGKDGGKKDK